MNTFTKFQPLSLKTTITVSKVFCCSLSATVWTHNRFFLFWSISFKQIMLRVSFLALHDKRTQKHVLNRQIGDLNVWPHLTSWPRMTSEVWNGLKLLTNGLNSNFTAWRAVTPAKLRKFTLQTHLQTCSNNSTLTWPVTTQMTWRSTIFFHQWIFQRYRLPFSRFLIWCVVLELGGGLKMTPQPSGWWVARRPSGCRVNKEILKSDRFENTHQKSTIFLGSFNHRPFLTIHMQFFGRWLLQGSSEVTRYHQCFSAYNWRR